MWIPKSENFNRRGDYFEIMKVVINISEGKYVVEGFFGRGDELRNPDYIINIIGTMIEIMYKEYELGEHLKDYVESKDYISNFKKNKIWKNEY